MLVYMALLILIAGCVAMINNGLARQGARAQSGDWPTYLGSNARTDYNGAETIINATTAPNLKQQWTNHAQKGISSQPVVANGMVYWGSWDGEEHGSRLTDGTDVWATPLGQTMVANCSPFSAGVAGAATEASVSINGQMTPVVFVGGGNAQFYALRADNGAVIWQTVLGSSPNHFIWSSPAVYNGSVYVGLASFGDCPVIRGQMVQMDAATGVIQNAFNLVPKGCTGGAVWGSPAIDETTGTLYFSTGNLGYCPTSTTKTIALVALSASNLSLVASWQVPSTQYQGDSDFGSTPTLFQATIGGVLHKMVGLANKNGVYYAFDRNTISSGPVWQVRIARGGDCPQCGDGSISSSAFDGNTLYVAGGTSTINGISCQGSLRALNPANGAFIWQDCLHNPVLGAVLAVPGVLVIGAGSYMNAMDAATGIRLFTFHDSRSTSNFWGPASISNGVLYDGNMDGILYAFSPS